MTTRKKYSKEYKLDAVSLVLDQSAYSGEREHLFRTNVNT